MSRRELHTIPTTRAAIRQATAVYVQPRFGTSEKWVRISKKDAMDMLSAIPAGSNADQAEMYGGVFGVAEDDGTVSLG